MTTITFELSVRLRPCDSGGGGGVGAGSALGGAGPNWEQFQSAQVPSQLALRSVLVCT